MDIIKWVKGWRLDRFFKELFQGQNNQELKDITAKAVLLVEKLKDYAGSPTVQFIETIIPGDWDKDLVAKVKAILPVVLEAFAKNSPCLDKPTLGEKVSCLIANIQTKPVDERTNFFHVLVAQIGVALSDGKFTLSDLFLLVEPVYRLFKKK